jgi:hypothetical protein
MFWIFFIYFPNKYYDNQTFFPKFGYFCHMILVQNEVDKHKVWVYNAMFGYMDLTKV